MLPGESQWTFGQSLAVMLVISPLVHTIDGMWKGYQRLREGRQENGRTVGEADGRKPKTDMAEGRSEVEKAEIGQAGVRVVDTSVL